MGIQCMDIFVRDPHANSRKCNENKEIEKNKRKPKKSENESPRVNLEPNLNRESCIAPMRGLTSSLGYVREGTGFERVERSSRRVCVPRKGTHASSVQRQRVPTPRVVIAREPRETVGFQPIRDSGFFLYLILFLFAIIYFCF